MSALPGAPLSGKASIRQGPALQPSLDWSGRFDRRPEGGAKATGGGVHRCAPSERLNSTKHHHLNDALHATDVCVCVCVRVCVCACSHPACLLRSVRPSTRRCSCCCRWSCREERSRGGRSSGWRLCWLTHTHIWSCFEVFITHAHTHTHTHASSLFHQ